MPPDTPSTRDKALQINIDAARYGTFAEIGAGQEVARWFFHVGGAAGTVAKTISAYDMSVSDAIYGSAQRYVGRQRLQAMLDYEWGLMLERLDRQRGASTMFFVFADTVAARSYTRQDEGHGWLGIRFQTERRGPASQIIIHGRMWDIENVRQQEALGTLGVNLIHGAFYRWTRPALLVSALMDGLTRDRVEVDMVRFSGPAFAGVDNRLMSLRLVEERLTNAALFTPDGDVVEPAELLYHQPVLVERGSFRPITTVTLDMLERSVEQMRRAPTLAGREPVVLMEMTQRSLLPTGDRIDHADFLARMDTLRSLGKTVMISNYSRFHNLVTYLRRYTSEPIAMALGVPTLALLLEDRHYRDLGGGLLEALGRLFSGPVTLMVYPWQNSETGELVTAESFTVPSQVAHLYAHLLENGLVEPIRGVTCRDLSVLPSQVLARLQSGDESWRSHVPPDVVQIIERNRLFGYDAAAVRPSVF
jgi:hypothetical protein